MTRTAGPLRRRFREIFLDQPAAGERLALTRLTLGAAIIRTVWHLPPGAFFAEFSKLLEETQSPRRAGTRLSAAGYETLRAATVLSVGAWAVGVEHPAVKVLANASYAALQRHVVGFDRELWSFTGHLNAGLALLSFADTRGGVAERNPQLASALLATAQAGYAMVYLQSGLAKFTGSGWRWLDGRTVRYSWGELGTAAGKRLALLPRPVAAAASVATVAFELGFAPALAASWRNRAAFGFASMAFHAAVKATMDISFWHFSWLAAPLFSAPPGLGRWVADHVYKDRRIAAAAFALACLGHLHHTLNLGSERVRTNHH
ncbi:hypothetical protein ACFQ05_35615 [Amycolatopsis umgeniensis]|uniref:HTTM domain-containing protein n=1 Tax=Amycolatopsis umgeniensis TaxID=336628 RepID=A0A841BB21_9PSEU|nr:hypothetical protein [Amycolatopsis umgeniensis]MBB5855714.1 hypothetical protein [Amycolatopsis umgeniensis]